ncbi:MAG: RrF2 family transcriptional regulator [Bacteroidia bacterium]
MLSKSSEYGIKAIIYLTKFERNERVDLKSIAENIDSPVAFTSKILQKLVKANLILSIKGKGGGFSVDSSRRKQLTVWDIIYALEGDDLQNRCVLGLSTCSSSKPCPAHSEFVAVRSTYLNFFKETTILSLTDSYTKGLSSLVLK